MTKREALAALEHRQWAHWTRYMLDNLTPENIERWRRQIDMPYDQLSEAEKQSDREWADRVFTELAELTETEEWPDYKGAEAFYRHYWRRMAKAEWEDLSPSTRLNYAKAFGAGRQAMLRAAAGGGDG